MFFFTKNIEAAIDDVRNVLQPDPSDISTRWGISFACNPAVLLSLLDLCLVVHKSKECFC